MSEINIQAKDGSGTFTGYLAKPASGRGPGVVVIQEIFGVNGFVRETADWLAAQGYIALAPDLIVVSAGFDAHHRDPLAQINLTEDDFDWATGQVMARADRHASGRLVSLLEGGYDLQGLAFSVAAHVGRLMKG